MIDWERRWSDLSPETLWGSKGAEEIEQLKGNIVDIETHIIDHLCRVSFKHRLREAEVAWSNLLGGYARAWLNVVKNHPNPVVQLENIPVLPDEHESISLYAHVVLALYKDKLLGDWIEKLCSSLGDLEIIAESYRNQNLGHEKLEREEDESAYIVEIRAENLQRAMENAYDKLESDNDVWALMFTFPHESVKAQLEKRERIQIDLMQLQEGFQTDKSGCRFSLSYPLDPCRQYHVIDCIDAQRNQQRTTIRTAKLSESLKYRLSTFAKTALTEADTVKAGTMFYRIRTALCIASWVTLGWYSNWIHDLCTCRIRHAILNDDSRIPLYLRKTSEPTHLEYECCESPFLQRPHLLLGLALSELALARPISARMNNQNRENLFCVWDYGIRDPQNLRNGDIRENMLRNVDGEELAHEAGLSVNWLAYRKAVAHCIALDKDQSGRPERVSGAIFRSYTKKVVEPLSRCYTEIEQHRKAHPQLYHDVEACWAF